MRHLSAQSHFTDLSRVLMWGRKLEMVKGGAGRDQQAVSTQELRGRTGLGFYKRRVDALFLASDSPREIWRPVPSTQEL